MRFYINEPNAQENENPNSYLTHLLLISFNVSRQGYYYMKIHEEWIELDLANLKIENLV